MDTNVYGPVLPPGFKEKEVSDVLPVIPKVDKSTVLKSQAVIGPQLPSELISRKEVECEDSDISDSDSKGIIGPAVPPGFTFVQAANDDEADSCSDSDSDSVYGPVPAAGYSESIDDVTASIEKRATDMKKKLQGTDKPTENVSKREEWMTLPAIDYKNQFGIISRCLVDEDHPKSSNKRPASSISSEETNSSVKDKQIKEELVKYNKSKRAESLLELHKKSRKKKDKELNKPKERKAFDRDAELGIRFMDQRQVNSVIRNSKKLNSRFSAGASQYL